MTPFKVFLDMVTLLRCKSTIKSIDQQPADDPADSTTGGNCTTCVGVVYVVCVTLSIGPPEGLALMMRQSPFEVTLA